MTVLDELAAELASLVAPPSSARHPEVRTFRPRHGERVAQWEASMRRRGVPPTDAAVEYAAKLYDLPCAYCGSHSDRPCIDHIVPVAKGGQTVPENLAPSCGPCNTRKGNKTVLWFLLEWAQKREDNRVGLQEYGRLDVRVEYEFNRDKGVRAKALLITPQMLTRTTAAGG